MIYYINYYINIHSSLKLFKTIKPDLCPIAIISYEEHIG